MMRWAVLSAALFDATAFTPLGITPFHRRGASAPQAVSMSWNPFEKKPAPAPKKPWGNENPFRILGVGEDAPYEEIERAVNELKEENKDDPKYLIQLDMMKEHILDQRMYARMSGALKAKVAESPFDYKVQEVKVPWSQKLNVFEKFEIRAATPERNYAIGVTALYVAFATAGLLAPTAAPTTIAFGFLASLGFIYNRGTPKVEGEGMPSAEVGANYGAVGKSVLLSGMMAAIGFTVGNLALATAPVSAAAADGFIGAFVNGFLGVGANFWQVQCIE